MANNKYRHLLRTLLLPIELKNEKECSEELKVLLSDTAGANFEEQANWLSNAISSWEEAGEPSRSLAKLIKQVVLVGSDQYGEIISENYFGVYNELISNQLAQNAQARSFLSHLLLITRLSVEERMSRAKIARILDTLNPSAGFGRRSLAPIINKLKVGPNLTEENIKSLYEDDKFAAPALFGDFSIEEAIEETGQVGLRLGTDISISDHLHALIDLTNLEKFSQYIQILHYQCSILEFCDHDVQDFYEFKPRGKAALWLFEQYPGSMVAAGNPFLNNAKSVSQVDFLWASAKKNKEFPGAYALYSILSSLDNLGYSARKEVALWVRCLIHKLIEFADPHEIDLPDSLDNTIYKKVFENLARTNTETRGILEQRVVDAATSAINPESKGWVARGIGDAVNASNLSKKKLGDCDFQNLNLRRVSAYEAHGGDLTQTYINEHIRTLSKLFKSRIEEWSTFSSPQEWTVVITFIAHSISAELIDSFEIEDVSVEISYITYEDFFNLIEWERISESLDTMILEPVNAKRTPLFVKERFLSLM